MRVHRVVFAALLVIAAAGAHAQQPVRYEPKDEKRPLIKGPLNFYPTAMGTIEGSISGAKNIPGRWLIALKSDAQELKFFSKEDGSFKLTIPSGVYAVWVKAVPGEVERKQLARAGKSVEFPRVLVRPGGSTRFEVDPTYEFIRCTKDGERVLPLTISHGQGAAQRELRAPSYDVYRLPSPGRDPFYLVVQSCGKSKDGPLIRYEDAVFSYSDDKATVIAAERVTLDTRDFKLAGQIYYYSRNRDKTSKDRIIARLRGSAVEIDSTARTVSSAKRRGR